MKLNTSLDHLPAVKRRELERVLGLIFEVFEEDTQRATALWRKQGRILKVILYGSYARGGWVDEPHTKKGYQSDFDLLIIVNRKRLSELGGVWSDVEDRLLREQLMKRLKTPVSLIVHTLDEVNTALLRGKYFFVDIYKEGRVLYEGPGRRLKTPQPLTSEAALREAQGYFDKWFLSATRRYELAQVAFEKKYLNEAAFDFHQATERLYHCVLLTLTLYTPALHDLESLRRRAESLDMRLAEAWPRYYRRDRRLFQLLRRAYVEARYSEHYEITKEEIRWLAQQIKALEGLVKTVCEERLATLAVAASSLQE